MKILSLTNRISSLTKLFSAGNGQKTTSNLLKYGMVLILSVTLWGCGSGNSSAPAAIDPVTGKHVSGWFDFGTGGAHPAAYIADPGSCEGCHGKDLLGGISKVSCSPGPNNRGCHDIFPHSAGFDDPDVHGGFATGALTPNGIFGMAHCQKCHGPDYRGGVGPSCINCHRARGSNPATNAPHGANWKVSGRHSKSDVTNAAACFQCHAGGAFSHPAQNPAPAGTAPGCFNGTLCHNDAIVHAVPFINATSHGKAIKITNDWAFCGNCHAAPSNDFTRYDVPIGRLTNGCETCHAKPYLAHPQMWLPGRGDGTPETIGGPNSVRNTSHIDVPAANVITSCTICHGITAPSANSAVPSCATASGQLIGGIRCHFTSPVNSAGLSNGCKSCHSFSSATDFANVTSNKHAEHITLLNTAFPDLGACLACHNNSPSSPPLGRGATHADGTPNVAVSTQFGLDAKYNPDKTCSGVSCHGGTTPAWTAASVGCPACHATPPNGTSFPNTANAHAKHFFTCNVCHNGAGSGTPQHASGTRVAAVVSLLPSAAGTSASYNSAAQTCANVICHVGNTTPAWTSTNLACTACHGTPPNGTSFPNTANAHSKHTALPGVICNTCHNGAGSGTSLHGNRVADVLFLTSQAVVATATFDTTTKTCFSVTCHGVNTTTPAWNTTNTNLGCSLCHTSAPSTGRHTKHFASIPAITCDTCHTGEGPGVGTHPDGAPVTGFPAKFNENGRIAGYNKTTGMCDNLSCHGGVSFLAAQGWTGSVPVLDPTNSDTCASCHTASGVAEPPAGVVPVPYIGPFSGKVPSGTLAGAANLHQAHTALAGFICTDCHTLAGGGHFNRLMVGNRRLNRGEAAGTVGGVGTSITSYSASDSSCAATCHFGSVPVYSWY